MIFLAQQPRQRILLKDYFNFSTNSEDPIRSKFCEHACVLGALGSWDMGLFNVAIVGSRKVSHYGMRVVSALMEILQDYPVRVISGGALGVDGCAHRQALRRHIPTAAFLVGPDARPSPRSHWPIFEEMVVRENHALIFPESLNPNNSRAVYKNMWLERNRYMVACADLLIVAEAALPSGSFSSVRAASDLGCSVLLVPGDIFSPLSSGVNAMIAKGMGHVLDDPEALRSFLDYLKPKEQLSLQIQTEPLSLAQRNVLIFLKKHGRLHASELLKYQDLSLVEVLKVLEELQQLKHVRVSANCYEYIGV